MIQRHITVCAFYNKLNMEIIFIIVVLLIGFCRINLLLKEEIENENIF